MTLLAYNELNPQQREIRLCTLLPGSFRDPLACTLSTVSLDDRPDYDSLSYVWGTPIFNKELVVHGSVSETSVRDKPSARNTGDLTAARSLSAPLSILMITTGLYTALRSLRKTDEPRVLWVDAVCIDQKNVDERSSQVSMMGDIYREAKECQIWLCEVEDITSKAGKDVVELDAVNEHDILRLKSFLEHNGCTTDPPPLLQDEVATQSAFLGSLNILRLLAEGKHFYEMPFFEIDASLGIKMRQFWYKSLRTFCAIVSQPWWKRVWIVQEAVLSPKATVHISEHKLPLSTFMSAAENHDEHMYRCCPSWDVLWCGNREIYLSLMDDMSVVRNLHTMMERYRNEELFCNIFLRTSFRESSDPRDYLYAYNGLFESPSLEVADYRLSTAHLYTRTMQAFICETGYLEFLHHGCGVGGNDSLRLASWVCDWSAIRRTITRSHLYSASKDLKHVIPSHESGVLTLEAVMVGNVSNAGHLVAADDFNILAKHVERWMRIAGSAVDTTTFLKILFKDVFYAPDSALRRLSPEDMRVVERWWEFLTSNKRTPKDSDDPDIYGVQLSLTPDLERAKLYLTDEGILGMGPHDLRRGDRIFVVKGSDVPLILRPFRRRVFKARDFTSHASFYVVRRGSLPLKSPCRYRGRAFMMKGIPAPLVIRLLTKNRFVHWSPRKCWNCYQFVGPCYLHGVMDGEAITPEITWQTIHLY